MSVHPERAREEEDGDVEGVREEALLPETERHEEEEQGAEETAACLDRWLTPRRVLLVFALLNFVTYFDRGAIAGSLSAIKQDRTIGGASGAISDTRSGVIVSAFMVGYMCTCPLFAALGAYIRAKYVILLGMLIWAAACLSTAVSDSYGMLLGNRVLVGVGEAAYVGFTVTIIDNVAPPDRRTSWIGVFYSMMPVGTAVGMAVAGLVSERATVGGLPLAPWRIVFLAEVAAAVPVLFAVAALPARYDTADPPHSGEAGVAVHVAGTVVVGGEPTASPVPAEQYLPLNKATMALLRNTNYLLVVMGLAMYCFVVGAISVWAIPLLAQGPLHLAVSTAAIVMGTLTSLCGVAGSLLGGWAVDRLGGSTGTRGSAQCELFSAVMVLICVPCGVVALCQTSLAPFLAAFVVSVVALFSVTAPINASILTVVPHALRPYAVSYSVLLIHFFGDFPSPTVGGVLSDAFNRGCDEFHEQTSCTLAEARDGPFRSRRCYWAGSAANNLGHCVNTYQLRDALLVIFSFLVIAVPCWLVVYVRLCRQAGQEERISDVVIVVANVSEHA